MMIMTKSSAVSLLRPPTSEQFIVSHTGSHIFIGRKSKLTPVYHCYRHITVHVHPESRQSTWLSQLASLAVL